MLNQIIVIVTHSPISSNKLLLRSIQQKGLDTKFAIIVNYVKKENLVDDIYKSKFNFEYFMPTKDVSEQHIAFKDSLPGKEKTFYLTEVVEKCFNCLMQSVPDLMNKNRSSLFDFHLFVEVNLADVGGELLTKDFHDAVYFFGNYFKRLVKPCLNHYYVYGYSQTQIAREKATRYFDGELVDNLQLDISIDRTAVDIKEKINEYIYPPEISIDCSHVEEKADGQNIIEDAHPDLVQAYDASREVRAGSVASDFENYSHLTVLQNNFVGIEYSIPLESINNYFERINNDNEIADIVTRFSQDSRDVDIVENNSFIVNNDDEMTDGIMRFSQDSRDDNSSSIAVAEMSSHKFTSKDSTHVISFEGADGFRSSDSIEESDISKFKSIVSQKPNKYSFFDYKKIGKNASVASENVDVRIPNSAILDSNREPNFEKDSDNKKHEIASCCVVS